VEAAPSSAEQDARWDGPDWPDVRDAVSDHANDYVGARDSYDSPYRQEGDPNRAAPPLRYNRVEGLVLGVQRDPLRPSGDERTRAFGQIGYAFGLDDIRYTAGVESRLYESGPTRLTLGVQYHEQTLSPDRWKTSYAENSLTSIGFEDDFFDYFEAEGLTAYARQTLPHTVQVTGGVRAEAHRSLTRQTDWSVFESGHFRANPAIEEGDLRALFGTVTAGDISNPGGLPTGAAMRVSATVADGVGGDFSFYRYEADARGFLPLTPDTRLGLRLRGGYATSESPLQSQFTLGGVGSMRGYGQNRFRGTRMLLANAEYLIDGATVFDHILEDLFVGGLVDAGWVGGPGTPFRMDDVLPSAGFSIGLDERQVRLDVAWPLRTVPASSSAPSIRLRIAPSF
jgi:outer membrane protein assembly factor BamA